MLDRCLAEFQDDSVQLVTAVSRVSERLHDLSEQRAGKPTANSALSPIPATAGGQVPETVPPSALTRGGLAKPSPETSPQPPRSQTPADWRATGAGAPAGQGNGCAHPGS